MRVHCFTRRSTPAQGARPVPDCDRGEGSARYIPGIPPGAGRRRAEGGSLTPNLRRALRKLLVNYTIVFVVTQL